MKSIQNYFVRLINDTLNLTNVDNFVLIIPKYLKFKDEFYLRERKIVTPIRNILKLEFNFMRKISKNCLKNLIRNKSQIKWLKSLKSDEF